MRCREATILDVPRIVGLGAMMHAESRYAKYPYSPAKINALVAYLIDNMDGIVLVSEHGMLFGMVDEFWFGEGRYANEYVLFCEPEHRKTGEAVALVRQYIELAKQKGAQEVMIEASTLVDVEATDRFFEKMGFRFCGGNFFMEV